MVLLRKVKKAQVETLGLVIIVAIIAFIFVIALIFASRQQPNLNQDYLKLKADNLRSTISKTTICQDTNIRDEIVSCNDLAITQCENINCNELQNIIKKIIDDSLNLTNNYKFEAGNILIKKEPCGNIFTSTSELVPYSDINITLALC